MVGISIRFGVVFTNEGIHIYFIEMAQYVREQLYIIYQDISIRCRRLT